MKNSSGFDLKGHVVFSIQPRQFSNSHIDTRNCLKIPIFLLQGPYAPSSCDATYGKWGNTAVDFPTLGQAHPRGDLSSLMPLVREKIIEWRFRRPQKGEDKLGAAAAERGVVATTLRIRQREEVAATLKLGRV